MTSMTTKTKQMASKIFQILAFIGFYMVEVVRANFILAWHILSPQLRMKPGIIKIPVNLTQGNAILLLVNLISMTPGTLTIDLSDDKKYIYVHTLFLSPGESTIEGIKKLEKKIGNLYK